jgi:hypothetical protein
MTQYKMSDVTEHTGKKFTVKAETKRPSSANRSKKKDVSTIKKSRKKNLGDMK